MSDRLASTLLGIDWALNVNEFLADPKAVESLERGCHLISVWNHELSFQDRDNSALPFLQEMKASLFYVPACLALGLYKPAASSMRSAVENALYFSYFRFHPSELNTLVSNDKYYISKADVINFHNLHTPQFKTKQEAIGLVSELESWYSEISAIVHGQIPGTWTTKSLSETAFVSAMSKPALREFSRAILLINYLFLITTDEETWDGFNSLARQLFLKGMSGVKKAALGRSII